MSIKTPKIKNVLSSKYFTARGPANPPHPNRQFIIVYQNWIFPALEIFMIEKLIDDSSNAKKIPL